MPNIYEDAIAPEGVDLYDPEDYASERQRIFDTIKDTMVKQFPREHNGVRMELHDVDYADPEDYSLADQKKALHEDKFLSRRLQGTLRLVDLKTGDVLDEKRMTLLKAPWLTNRNTFIREGNEWGTISQQRMLPGAYSRIQNNGDLETQFNVRPGTGAAFRVNFNPETTQYKISLGGSELHLYSLMRDLGVTEEELADRWGQDVAEANADKYDSRTLEKAYNKLVPSWDRDKNENRTREEKAALVKRALDRSQVATKVVNRTLPNMNNRIKAANWKLGGEMLEKVASMSRDNVQDIALYINSAAGKNISIDGSRDEIIEDIMNTVATGLPDGDVPTGKIDPADQAAAVVRGQRMRRVIEQINKHLTKHKIKI